MFVKWVLLSTILPISHTIIMQLQTVNKPQTSPFFCLGYWGIERTRLLLSKSINLFKSMFVMLFLSHETNAKPEITNNLTVEAQESICE